MRWRAQFDYIGGSMPETKYRNRRAWQIENTALRVTVLVEGGHIAEIFHKASGVNPLWTPPCSDGACRPCRSRIAMYLSPPFDRCKDTLRGSRAGPGRL